MNDFFDQIIEAARRQPYAVAGLTAAAVDALAVSADGAGSRKPEKYSEKDAGVSASSQIAVKNDAPAAELPHPGTLDELRCGALSCSRCVLSRTRTNVVFGEGDPQAKLMFIGEGPGNDEDLQGRPFVGAAGQLLDKMITAMQFSRESVYIANIVKCRPPGNRAPAPEEAVACIGFLKKQIEFIRPQVIVLLGATAAKFLLERQEGITRLRGRWLEYQGIPVMPTYHPAFLLRQASAKREVWNDLQQVMARFGKTYPGSASNVRTANAGG